MIATASTMRLTGMPARSLSSRTAEADGPSYTEKTTSSAGIRMQPTSRMRAPSLGHLGYHVPGPVEGFEKQLARHAGPVTLDQVRGHVGPSFAADATATGKSGNPLNQ